MHDTQRTANLLGAAALALSEKVLTGVGRETGVSTSGAAALVVLSASTGLGVTEVGRRVGLSQPAAARMLDSLESAGLVERRPGAGRSVPVALTAAGRRTVQQLLAARQAPLAEAVEALSERDREELARLLGTLLTHLYSDVRNAELICRLCDRACCVRDAVCPVGQAERDAAAPDAAASDRGDEEGQGDEEGHGGPGRPGPATGSGRAGGGEL